MLEKKVLTNFIELYRDFPCLWDLSSDQYKDNSQKNLAWEVLAEKLKELDPDANVASAKKKIENLRSSYKREAKKIKELKKQFKVHKPSLWYFKLMTFLDQEDQQTRGGIDTISCDDQLSQGPKGKKRKIRNGKTKKKLIETTQDLPGKPDTKPSNSFGVYVGEQLQVISENQRVIAEKLIADVLFLAKTNNLNFDSHIENMARQRSSICTPYSFSSPNQSNPYPHHDIPSPSSPQSQILTRPIYIQVPMSPTLSQPTSFSPSPNHNIQSPHHNSPSPQHNSPSPQHNSPSPQHNSPSPQHNSSTPQHNLPSSFSPHILKRPTFKLSMPSAPSQPIQKKVRAKIEGASGSVLKNMLISNNYTKK